MTPFPNRLAGRGLILGILTALVATSPVGAVDGGGAMSTTYYEQETATASAEMLNSTSSALPATLHFSDSTASVQYVAIANDGEKADWLVKMRGLFRTHERVDAIYQMVLILPLPVDAEGRAAFRPSQWSISPREGIEGASVPLIYSGEKVRLKRNRSLERSFLPRLISPSGTLGKLPSLAGSGYDYTLWDTIVRYDPDYGDSVQVFSDFAYTTAAGVPAPDAADERLKAYVITWIPKLDPSIAPFTVRMDVIDPQ